MITYWAKAGVANSSWPRTWTCQTILLPGSPPVGGIIDTVTIPIIQPKDSAILKMLWIAPNSHDFIGIIEEYWHYCLLARIVAPFTDPMKTRENSDVNYNSQCNNNIAWKNIDIINITQKSGNIGGTIFAGNLSDLIITSCLRFKARSGSTTLHQEAEITVRIDSIIYQAWQRGGALSSNIEIRAKMKSFIRWNSIMM